MTKREGNFWDYFCAKELLKVETCKNLGLEDNNTACIFHGCYAGIVLSIIARVMASCKCIHCSMKEAEGQMEDRMTGRWREEGSR